MFAFKKRQQYFCAGLLLLETTIYSDGASFIWLEILVGSRHQVSAEVQLGAATPADPSGTSRN